MRLNHLRRGSPGLARGVRLLALTVCLAPGLAVAQVLDKYAPPTAYGYNDEAGVTVTTRLRPDYDAPGVKAGSFVVRPSVYSGLAYDDNLLGLKHKESGTILGTGAALDVRSDWNRHALNGLLSFDNRHVMDGPSGYPSQSTTDYQGVLDGFYDLGRDRLRGAVYHQRLNQSPADIASPTGQRSPTPYDLDGARVGYEKTFNRLTLTPQLELSQYHYGSTKLGGEHVSQSDSDHRTAQAELVARYETSPHRALLGVVRAGTTSYDNDTPGQSSLDSTGLSALVGFDTQADAVFRYRALIGIETRQYKSSDRDGQTTPVVELGGVWTPDGLTTVTGTLSRTIQDATAGNQDEYVYTRGRVVVDHEFLRNLLLNASVGAEYADFIESGGDNQTILTTGVGATWLINRRLKLNAGYQFSQSVSDGPNDYNRNILQLRLDIGF
ncbi:hypothetical protein SAMN07250955_11363 [Arboricoccus pini]|uniref:Beta-barrel porin 2 n=1 Tax=Arboricoccus pini TaxID=1963835 RepID=A0A212RSH9_9PROT|nr:outer membrane beta-barrel protein [Arboricoccus pini]SNB75487.1 hypothetical protein SAMN07250955_11363 [Arboricoccus pini]